MESEDKTVTLAQTMAFLLATTRETAIGRLLNFCLASKVISANSGRTPLEFAEELLASPELLAEWLTEVVHSDERYTRDEMVALLEMKVEDTEAFMVELFKELRAVGIDR